MCLHEHYVSLLLFLHHHLLSRTFLSAPRCSALLRAAPSGRIDRARWSVTEAWARSQCIRVHRKKLAKTVARFPSPPPSLSLSLSLFAISNAKRDGLLPAARENFYKILQIFSKYPPVVIIRISLEYSWDNFRKISFCSLSLSVSLSLSLSQIIIRVSLRSQGCLLTKIFSSSIVWSRERISVSELRKGARI